MPELTPSLDVSIAEGKIVTADLSPALAESCSVTAGAALAIAETSSIEAGLHMRIVMQGAKLIAMDAQIEDEWENANTLAKRDMPVVIHLGAEKAVKAVLLKKTGLPKAIVFHRSEGDLVRCSSVPCNHCAEDVPRRTITVLNIYEFEERAVRLLVCDERLAVLTHQTIAGRDIEKLAIGFRNAGPDSRTFREHAYEVLIMPEVIPEDWAVIKDLTPIDVSTIPDVDLVGMLF
jgi:hypothetical protein